MLMPLQATRSIATGDGWDRTDSGIDVSDCANPVHVQLASIMHPDPQPIAIDLFAAAGGFSLGFKHAMRCAIIGDVSRDTYPPAFASPG
jgi:hypothetical protein